MTYINVNDIEQMIKSENISTIFLDVDGVVIQSVRAMCELFNMIYDVHLEPIQVTSWNFNEYKSDMTADEVESLFENPKFFDLVKVYDGVLEFINRYKDKIIFLSKGTTLNGSRKREYFDELGLTDIPLIMLPLNISKGYVNMGYNGKSLFIDDCSQNLIDSNADIKIMFHEFNNCAEWQLEWDGLEIKEWK